MEASHFREHLGAGLLGGMRRYGDRGQCPSDLERAGALRRACGYRRAHALRRDTFNAANLLVSAQDYASFADQAHFDWVTAAWRAVVAPNVFLFISLLVVFEAVVGVLILSGGRRTQVGLVGAIAFHLAMWLFGWGVTIYALIMVPALALLLRAERRAAAVSATTVAASTAADLEVAGRKAE
jgi:hypothetical protein